MNPPAFLPFLLMITQSLVFTSHGNRVYSSAQYLIVSETHRGGDELTLADGAPTNKNHTHGSYQVSKQGNNPT
ncbi:unnamed protein product [Linum trigynum]|uniref:Uncharacterized protein n=1 Tax=Linum trigynum TaxID=586398 RepID=A0AAV2CUZ8_9ROSI